MSTIAILKRTAILVTTRLLLECGNWFAIKQYANHDQQSLVAAGLFSPMRIWVSTPAILLLLGVGKLISDELAASKSQVSSSIAPQTTQDNISLIMKKGVSLAVVVSMASAVIMLPAAFAIAALFSPTSTTLLRTFKFFITYLPTIPASELLSVETRYLECYQFHYALTARYAIHSGLLVMLSYFMMQNGAEYLLGLSFSLAAWAAYLIMRLYRYKIENGRSRTLLPDSAAGLRNLMEEFGNIATYVKSTLCCTNRDITAAHATAKKNAIYSALFDFGVPIALQNAAEILAIYLQNLIVQKYLGEINLAALEIVERYTLPILLITVYIGRATRLVIDEVKSDDNLAIQKMAYKAAASSVMLIALMAVVYYFAQDSLVAQFGSGIQDEKNKNYIMKIAAASLVARTIVYIGHGVRLTMTSSLRVYSDTKFAMHATFASVYGGLVLNWIIAAKAEISLLTFNWLLGIGLSFNCASLVFRWQRVTNQKNSQSRSRAAIAVEDDEEMRLIDQTSDNPNQTSSDSSVNSL